MKIKWGEAWILSSCVAVVIRRIISSKNQGKDSPRNSRKQYKYLLKSLKDKLIFF